LNYRADAHLRCRIHVSTATPKALTTGDSGDTEVVKTNNNPREAFVDQLQRAFFAQKSKRQGN
jgi:hypothetical protein